MSLSLIKQLVIDWNKSCQKLIKYSCLLGFPKQCCSILLAKKSLDRKKLRVSRVQLVQAVVAFIMAIKLFSQDDCFRYLDLIRDKYTSIIPPPPHPRHDFINVEKHVIRLGLDWTLINSFTQSSQHAISEPRVTRKQSAETCTSASPSFLASAHRPACKESSVR